ncbi:putative ATPase [Vibrio nigripulchritudo SFn27]|uniref:Putative ATPase n=1 Tax=Vibrio nigripulchritudo TaxID=28173 RepID=U4K9B6_9VIBR|nr:SPFH domain-containing protein [Vibrio nigripulchritudo]CCN85347.1 putative ATPase [Vibrio nigripulchritudo BLFn1]CCN87903.1 putative ATPase [Vibrio nigripulchritudo SFn27]CCN94488.1 putative ATPase [Vibrio nigripulchritudo ENn2]CCO41413.1 putative ATPase [Vibrio nigripulchritudo SFn135]CCO54412.1 putative ATPase [Vibrio nigripulchritudo Wn13]
MLGESLKAEEKRSAMRKGIKGALIGVPLLAFGLTINSSVLMTDAGYTYVHQNNITGELDVFTQPGIHFRMPFLSKITKYDQVITVSFGNNTGEDFYQRLDPVQVRFADTYIGEIPVTFRFKLSTDPEAAIKMHREFRNNSNLIDALLVKNARNVTVITATQYTGEEFFQGGLNQFKSKLGDQLRDGIYLTERKQVEVEQLDLAPVGMEQSDANKLQRTQQLVWKTVPVRDANGQPIRQDNPLQQYGIQVTQVTIGDPQPETQLDQLLADKKRLVADRIRAIQEQETSKAQAETEQLRKEIQRTREVQDAQRQKELAIISQQKEVEIARQIAEREIVEVEKKKRLAEVEKEKELAIAEANLAIQKANSLSAEFEAKAILEKGNAEAQILKAKYAALGANREVYLAELNRDVANVLYNNLQNFQVEMPQNYIGGSNESGLTSNLDVITAFGALGVMDKAQQVTTK